MILRAICIAAALAAFAAAASGPVAAMEDAGAKTPIVVAADSAAADQSPAAETAEPKPAKKVASSNPLSGDPDAIALGRRLFGDWCSVCHGIRANGESRFGKYAANLTKFWRGYNEFTKIVKNGRTGEIGMMPPFGKPPDNLVLDDDSISKIGAFLETLADEGANWK